ADAQEAVDLALRLRPDVALLDVQMPGGGGPRATRAIRTSCPRTQVVAISAHEDREAVIEMIRAGAVGYLVKGVPGEELLTAIRPAAKHFDHLPRSAYLSVNVSPATALSMHFVEAVQGVDPKRLVVEITEHAPVSDYEALGRALGTLRGLGVRVAIDDAGSGF